jgi:hypothetical protein
MRKDLPNRKRQRFGGLLIASIGARFAVRPACGLTIRDTADCQSALRANHRSTIPSTSANFPPRTVSGLTIRDTADCQSALRTIKMSDIVQKLWGFCHTLRHDGVDYGDYIEQLTYLLFLKMAEERGAEVPKKFDWASLKEQSGTALTDHYADILRKLREQPGILGDIFAQATPRFNNPVNLKRVIAMIDEEDWSAMDVDGIRIANPD